MLLGSVESGNGWVHPKHRRLGSVLCFLANEAELPNALLQRVNLSQPLCRGHDKFGMCWEIAPLLCEPSSDHMEVSKDRSGEPGRRNQFVLGKLLGHGEEEFPDARKIPGAFTF